MDSLQIGTIADVPDATNLNTEVNGNTDPVLPETYVVSDDYIHKNRSVRIICIGAGIAGIAAAYKFQQRLSDASFVIYEKNHDVGGTWLENRYPGCACMCSRARGRCEKQLT